MSRGLDGTNPRSYVGVRPLTPPNMIIPGIRPTSQPRNPTQNDIQYNLGDLWLNTNTEGLWYLAALGSHLVGGINTRFATWLQFGTGTVKTLTGNTGGPVGPDVNGNINTIGDVVSGIVVNGNPGTNTLTWTSSGGGHFGETLTGDTGGPVQFDAAGNINVITDNASVNAGATVLIVGTPLNNTLTLNVTDADSNTLVGKDAGNLTLSGEGNTGLGAGVLLNLSTGDSNTAVGTNALEGVSTGNNNTAVGSASLTTLSTGSNNTAVGTSSLTAATTASFNTAVGSGLSLGAVTTGASNTALGYSTLDEITTGANNVAVGAGAGGSYTGAESNNIVIGQGITGIVGESNVLRIGTNTNGVVGTTTKCYIANCYSNRGTNNTFVGALVGNDTFTIANAFNNVAVGVANQLDLTTGFNCTSVGHLALRFVTTGDNNTAIGTTALGSVTTGAGNVGIGHNTVSTSTGNRNVGVGGNALSSIATGSDNVALGHNAGDFLTTTDSNNLDIANEGVVGDNNIIRIGSNGGGNITAHTKFFVAAVRGVTTDVNDAIAVLIDSAGQLGTVSSSIRFKENVEDMGDYSDNILALRPVTFNYKNRPCERKSVGLIAEEVGEVMPDLVVFDKEGIAETVRYNDLVPMLLNEVQKMKIEIQQLQAALNK